MNRVRNRRVGSAASWRTDDQTRRKRIEFPGKSAFVYPWPREGFLFVFGSPLINVHVESRHCFLSKRPPRYLSAQVIANTSPFVPPPWPSSTGPFPSTTALSPLLSSISTKISTNAQIFLFSLRGKPSSRIMQVFRGKRKKRERRIIMDLLSSLHLEARYARGFFSFDVRKDSDRAYVKSMTVDVGPTRAAHGG